MERIEKLRQHAIGHSMSTFCNDEFYYHFYKNYSALEHLCETERYSESYYAALSDVVPFISEDELIVGKRSVKIQEEYEKEWNEIYKPIAWARRNKAGNGQDSHMAIDYPLLLSEGILGIIKKIESYMQNCDEKQLLFYKSCKRCLEAVIKHSENYAECALMQSKECSDETRKAELLKIAEICKKVPAQPAETFYEAVQSVSFITHCLSYEPYRLSIMQYQLGHPDKFLLPYYEKDVKNGTLTKEFAQELLDCLGIQMNMRVPSGVSSGYMVGGRDKDGKIVSNELTDMCMQVIDDIRLVYPSVGLCYTDEMPDSHLEKACELLKKGYSHPAIFGDDIITKGLMHYGVPERDAHEYIHCTCVEITPVAASNVWVASPYTNMVQFLLDSMEREYENLDALIAEIFKKLDCTIKTNFEAETASRIQRAENCINPLLSCFVDDCLSLGLDIEQGGAKYNWIMPSFIGMANLVDSIYAVKKLVFEDKKLTLCEFKSILDKNFEGHEDLRLYIQNHIDKYGNDIDEIDAYFSLFSDHIVEECKKYQSIHQNADIIPSVFCWIKHEQYGSVTGATPDGRVAGFPLGDGSGPCQGRELKGPTSSIISSTKWEHYKYIGGVAVNLKFSKASLGENSTETLKTLIKTYIQRGGLETQINVIDNETLKKAQLHPEEYRDLVVRIGGYSDYFVTLSPQMQNEVILRTAHKI